MSELKNLEKKAMALHKCHNYNASKYKKFDNLLSNATILLGLILTSVIPLIDIDLKSKEMVNTIVGIFVTIISAFTKSFKPAEKYEKHRYSSQQYISLKYKIRQKIIQAHPDDQRNLHEIDEVTKNFESLRKECPFISDNLYDNQYKKTLDLLNLNTVQHQNINVE